jgi:hypothetical protein
MNKILASLAFVLLMGFLSVLLIHVPRLDLLVIISITVALAGWDLFTTLFRKKG